jgi:hypothetical protein
MRAMASFEPMEIRIGAIAAQCPACSGTFFKPVDDKPRRLRMSSALTCASCGKPTTYADLVSQAADKAVQRSRELLAKMRRPEESKP